MKINLIYIRTLMKSVFQLVRVVVLYKCCFLLDCGHNVMKHEKPDCSDKLHRIRNPIQKPHISRKHQVIAGRSLRNTPTLFGSTGRSGRWRATRVCLLFSNIIPPSITSIYPLLRKANLSYTTIKHSLCEM